jgi:hypothetical protein
MLQKLFNVWIIPFMVSTGGMENVTGCCREANYLKIVPSYSCDIPIKYHDVPLLITIKSRFDRHQPSSPGRVSPGELSKPTRTMFNQYTGWIQNYLERIHPRFRLVSTTH